MRYLDDLKDMLCKELEELAEKGELSAGDLETIHKLTSSIKNIDKIEMFKDIGEYSEDDGYVMRSDYDRGNSYANRGKHYVRGHYSRDGSRDYSMRRGRDGRYSRDDGKHHMIERLESMMDEAESEKEREAIRHCISKIENA